MIYAQDIIDAHKVAHKVEINYLRAELAKFDGMLPVPAEDANDLDDVVRELGIEASETTPAEAVRELKAEIDRLRAELAAKDERRVIETKKWVIAETELAEAKARIAHWENLGAGTSDAYTPDLGPEEKIVWILGDMMNAVENHFGVENAKRLGHIHCCADRLLREVIDPKDARIAALEAAGNRLGDAVVDGVLTSIEAVTELAEAKARIAELEHTIDLADDHTVKIMTALEAAIARAERAEADRAKADETVANAMRLLHEEVDRAEKASENGCLRAELSQTKRDLKDWQDSSEAYRHDAEKAEARVAELEAANHGGIDIIYIWRTRAEKAEAHIKELNNKWADDVLRVDALRGLLALAVQWAGLNVPYRSPDPDWVTKARAELNPPD